MLNRYVGKIVGTSDEVLGKFSGQKATSQIPNEHALVGELEGLAVFNVIDTSD